LIVLSCDPEARAVPSFSETIVLTPSVWPDSVDMHSSVSRFHTLIVRSDEAENIRSPQIRSEYILPLCDVSVSTHTVELSAVFHALIVPLNKGFSF